MPLDPSIILQGKPVQFEDPTALRMRGLQLQNAQMQNDQARKEVGDQRTLADLYKRNLSDDGSVNNPAMVGGMAQAGLGAKIPGYQKSVADSQKAQTESQTAQFDIHKKKLDYVNGVLSSLIQKPDLQQNDLITSINQMVNNGVIDANQGAQMARQIPGRPEQLRPFLIQKGLETMDASKRLEMMTPQYNEQDRGDVINQGTVDKLTGTRTPGVDIKKTMTPDQAAKVKLQGDNKFTGDDGDILAALALRGVSLPAGLRSKDQQISTIRGLRQKNPELSAEEIADKVASGQLGFGVEKKETTTAAGLSGKIRYAENEIKQLTPLIREASAAVPRGSFVPWNKLKQMAEGSISDPNLKEFKSYMNSLSNAYDMLSARGGTDMEKRKHNREMFDTADSPEALERALKAVETEAAISDRAAVASTQPRGKEVAPAGAVPDDIAALLQKHGAK